MRLILAASILLWTFAAIEYARSEEVSESFDRASASKRLRGAAVAGWSKTAEEAIRFGADVDETDEYGTTPLILASIRGHDRVAKLLLDAGADPNRKNDDRMSPIMAASANCNDPVVTLLLKRGAHPNPRSLTRQTPLMRAAENGCAVVMRELLKVKGIDPNTVDDTGRTALDYARESSVLGLDGGDSLALIVDFRRSALPKAGRLRVIRRSVILPRGTNDVRSIPRSKAEPLL